MMIPETRAHIEMIVSILVPLGSALWYVIKQQRRSIRDAARLELKVDTMWAWFTNHGSDITGYKKGEK